MPLITMGAIMGGNVRVGLEDSLYLGKGQLAKSNAEQVTPHPHHPREPVARDRDARRGAHHARPERRRPGQLLMIDKRVPSLAAAVAGISDGMTVLCAGFGAVGEPVELIEALARAGRARSHHRRQQCRHRRARHRHADPRGQGAQGHLLLSAHAPTRMCSRRSTSAGRIELELVPQGTLSERIRAGGAGIGGFFTRVSAGTRIGEGKESARASTASSMCSSRRSRPTSRC